MIYDFLAYCFIPPHRCGLPEPVVDVLQFLHPAKQRALERHLSGLGHHPAPLLFPVVPDISRSLSGPRTADRLARGAA